MAHTDACKYQVCQLVEKLVVKGESVNAACKVAQEESDGIPAETIRRWWKDIQNEAQGLVKNDQRPKLTPEIVVERVKQIHKQKGVPYPEAIKEIAQEEGRRPATVQRMFSKEMERQAYKPTATQAIHLAQIAISQLERIADDDANRHEAFNLVRTWMDAEEAVCSK